MTLGETGLKVVASAKTKLHVLSLCDSSPAQGQFGLQQNRGMGLFGPYPGLMSGASLPGMMQTQLARDPMERIPVEHQNRAFIERQEGIMDRMDDGASWRGSGAIYA